MFLQEKMQNIAEKSCKVYNMICLRLYPETQKKIAKYLLIRAQQKFLIFLPPDIKVIISSEHKSRITCNSKLESIQGDYNLHISYF